MIAYRTGVFGAVSGQCAARYIRERRDVERFWREGEQERESESESESDREREFEAERQQQQTDRHRHPCDLRGTRLLAR